MNVVKFKRKYFYDCPRWTAFQFPYRENQQELLKIPFPYRVVANERT